MSDNLARRDFLKAGGAAAAGVLAGPASAAGTQPAAPFNPRTAAHMPTRLLGATGHRVGLFSLGGQATLEQPNRDEEALTIVERALDLGVNYVDTSIAYGRGQSHRYIGQVMARRRSEVFLASKTPDRTNDGARRDLEATLVALHTDHLDSWQMHRVSTARDIEQIFAPSGAIEAFQWAKEQRLVRFLGISGHTSAAVLIEMIRRFPFDTVLMAFNAADRHHGSFAAELLPLAVERQMGIIAMKIPARSRILSSFAPPPDSAAVARALAAGRPAPAPLVPGTITMRDALNYVLSHPVSTVIVGCDSPQQVEENVRLASEFTQLSEAQLAALSELTAGIARQALFFRSWT
jgi:aryl-alcohol dehydrogenase-like predicted oxidoreductase